MSSRPLCLALLFALACDTSDIQEAVPEASLQLLTPADVQPADSSLRVTVGAVAAGNFNPRVVVFRTSAGVFLPASSAVATVPLSADGTAQALLKPPATPGAVLITATAGSTTVVDSVRFSAELVSPVWHSFEVTPATVSGDGMSTVQLRAQLSERGRRLSQQVTFTSSAGRFANNTTTIPVQVDATGTAEATLIVPEAQGALELQAQAAGEVLRRTVALTPSTPFVLAIGTTPPMPEADGASTVVVTVTRDPRAHHVTQASLAATAGVFLPGNALEQTVHFDAGGRALALFRVPESPGRVLLRASRGTETLLDSVWVQPALPDAIQVTGPPQLDPRKGEAATIIAALRRAIGTPSRGIPVQFTAATTAGQPIGMFLSQPISDDKDEARAAWFLADTTFTGTVLISARVRSAAGDTLIATYPLQVIKP